MTNLRERLRRETAEAQTKLQTEQAAAQQAEQQAKQEADERLYQGLVASIPEKLESAKEAGRYQTVIWLMGDFGHLHSDEVTESVPLNWEVMRRLEHYLFDQGLYAAVQPMVNSERFREYHYFALIASWE